MTDKSATSARIQEIPRTSGSHVHEYAPLLASTESLEYKRFRSICLKQDVRLTQKNGDS